MARLARQGQEPEGRDMKFVMSYSCGKDSTLALHKMAEQGHEPVCLLVMVKEQEDRSWFHGADRALLAMYEQALGLPMLLCPSCGADYHLSLEDGLRRAMALGAEAACFGDIDLEANRRWEEDRCQAVGLYASFPLWQREREGCVRELVSLGYKCLIKSVDRALLPVSLLGRYIDSASIAELGRAGVDVCGENGEYHTLAVDGPVFRQPLAFRTGQVLELGTHAVIEVTALPCPAAEQQAD